MAAYQAAATIARAIESALAQTLAPTEIIVCDDGSNDGLESALTGYRDRITLLRQENAGAAAARNRAAAAATGEFVVILDADDAYLPQRLMALAELASARPDLDLLTTDAFLVDDGRRVGRYYEGTPFATEDQRAEILRWCFVGGWPAVRRERLLDIGGFDPDLARAEDWDCWMRLILGGARVGLVDAPLMEYTLNSHGLTFSRAESLESRVTVLRKNIGRLSLSADERRVAEASLKLHSARAAVARALQGLADGDEREARKRALALLSARGLPLRFRARAAAAWLQPSHVDHWLGEGRTHTGRLDP